MSNFLKNKYRWSFFLLLAYGLADGLLHKGMLRVLLPSPFEQDRVMEHMPECQVSLIGRNAFWLKGVNTIRQVQALDPKTAGIEMDVYFDSVSNDFLVFHDSSDRERTPLEALIRQAVDRNINGGLWLDFKNLGPHNVKSSLERLVALRDSLQWRSKIIVESGDPESLQEFCNSGFSTSYYVPLFNPYLLSREEREEQATAIAALCRRFPVSALSGYYFQYPFLKHAFPGMPVLTWVASPRGSVVNYFFERKLRNDPALAVILKDR